MPKKGTIEPFADEVEPKVVEIGDLEFTVKPLSGADSAAINKETMKINPRTGDLSVDSEKVGTERLVRCIVDWNITDEDGEKVPINKDNVLRLRDPIIQRLLEASRQLDTVSEITGKG